MLEVRLQSMVIANVMHDLLSAHLEKSCWMLRQADHPVRNRTKDNCWNDTQRNDVPEHP